MELPKIFVQIASYRDDELPKTIRSCLDAAAHPERLTFGICHQYDDHTKHMTDEYRADSRFRVYDMPWQEARGAGYARYICNKLWRGEEFTLQVDAHTRFAKGWDESLIDQWRSCDDKKAVLSVYPLGYTYDDDGNEQVRPMKPSRGLLVLEMFVSGDIPKLWANIPKVENDGSRPRLGYFVGGNMLFCAGSVCREVVYEKDVAFLGEEVVHSLRLFTAGYTIYRPRTAEVYHLYRTKTSQYWKDQTEIDKLADYYKRMTHRSYETVRAILEGRASHRLGNVRTLEEFERYVGVDFKQRVVHPDQRLGKLPPLAEDMSWVDTLFPLQEQTLQIKLKEVLPDYHKYERVLVWLYDENKAHMARTEVGIEGLIPKEGVFDYRFTARMKPRAYGVCFFTKTGTWIGEFRFDL